MIAIRTTADILGTDDVFAFGGKHGYGLLNKKDKTYRYIKQVWNADEKSRGFEHRLRGNDGAVDSQGRYWLGMMNDPRTDSDFKPEGECVFACMSQCILTATRCALQT